MVWSVETVVTTNRCDWIWRRLLDGLIVLPVVVLLDGLTRVLCVAVASAEANPTDALKAAESSAITSLTLYLLTAAPGNGVTPAAS